MLAIEDVKQGRKRYLVFNIEDDSTLKVEKCGSRSATYSQFLKDLKPNECRYGLFDYDSRIFVLLWYPSIATAKSKMIYSLHCDALKELFVGIDSYIEATDKDEASQDHVKMILNQDF